MASRLFTVDLDLGLNKARRFIFEDFSTNPTGTTGRVIYWTAGDSSANHLKVYNGTAWKTIAYTDDVPSISISLDAATGFNVTGSPAGATGTLTFEWDTVSANSVLAGAVSGSNAIPTFRALVDADIPVEIARVDDIPVSGTDYIPYNEKGEPLGVAELNASGVVPSTQLDLTGYQPLDADLTAIAGLTGTSGLLRKTAADTYQLDTSIYLTKSSDANSSISIGTNSLLSNTTGIRNVALGTDALKLNTIGSNNNAVGWRSLDSNTEGVGNIAMGSETLQANTTGTYNTAIGHNSLLRVETGSFNVGLGYNAGAEITLSGSSNVSIGKDSGPTGDVSNNVMIGRESGQYNTGNQNTFLGYLAGKGSASWSGSSNVAVGGLSLAGSSTSKTENTAVGNQSLYSTESNFSTAVGYQSLNGSTTGSKNTALGHKSGFDITTGSKNVIIGSNTGSTIATLSNNIIISDGDGNIRAQYLSANSGWTIAGSTTFSGNISIPTSIIFEGATADDYETTVTVTDPTADRTITLPNASGTVALLGSITLGTDTSGNYVSEISAGTGIGVSHTPGEGSTATITNNGVTSITGTSNEITVSGTGSDPYTGAITIGLPDDVTIGGDLTVTGDLTVNGDVTTLNTATMNIEDNIFVLNSNVTGTPTTNSGLEVERGTYTNASIYWNESANKWYVGTPVDTTDAAIATVIARKYVTTTTGTTHTITHNLNTSDVTVNCWLLGSQVEADVVVTDANTVTVTTNTSITDLKTVVVG